LNGRRPLYRKESFYKIWWSLQTHVLTVALLPFYKQPTNGGFELHGMFSMIILMERNPVNFENRTSEVRYKSGKKFSSFLHRKKEKKETRT